MFSGKTSNIRYTMEKVPLRIGVKIRPDDHYYSNESINSYKETASKLNNILMSNEMKA